MPLFTFKKEEEIKGLWFFKDDNGELKKKNYIYITEDNKIKIKGLSIIKSTASKLSQQILNILTPLIIERNNIKFEKTYIDNIVFDLLKNDILLVANYYKVKRPETYKNKTSIQYQIAENYGSGEYYLVPNFKIGKVGKHKKYCSLEEAKELNLKDLDLTQIWEELSVFIKDYESPTLQKRKNRAMVSFEKEQNDKIQDYFNSDLFDSESVADDGTDEDYLEIEKFWDMK